MSFSILTGGQRRLSASPRSLKAYQLTGSAEWHGPKWLKIRRSFDLENKLCTFRPPNKARSSFLNPYHSNQPAHGPSISFPAIGTIRMI